jgi:hypothetical protein
MMLASGHFRVLALTIQSIEQGLKTIKAKV